MAPACAATVERCPRYNLRNSALGSDTTFVSAALDRPRPTGSNSCSSSANLARAPECVVPSRPPGTEPHHFDSSLVEPTGVALLGSSDVPTNLFVQRSHSPEPHICPTPSAYLPHSGSPMQCLTDCGDSRWSDCTSAARCCRHRTYHSLCRTFGNCSD